MKQSRGRPPHADVLTPAEWRVLNWVKHGLTNSQIVQRLGVSVDAVKYHVTNLLQKLQADNRMALRVWSGAPLTSAKSRRQGSMSGEIRRIGQIARTVRNIEELMLKEQGSEHQHPEDSVVYFEVDDIDAAYQTLQDRGAHFESAPHMIHRHDDGVEEWMAFFSDPDGKTLAVMAKVAP